MIKEINPDVAKNELDQGALLVDVREYDEVVEFACDVPETVVMPLSEFSQRYIELPKDRDMVLVCAGGGRSLHAARFLVQQGYTRVVNLYGGVFTWNAMGLPVKRSGRAGDAQSVNACNLWNH